MQKSIFSQKIQKKFVYYNEELVHKFKFQTQLSRKLQRFRTCRKNKKCSIFHGLSEYIIFSYDCNLLDWSFKQNFFLPQYAYSSLQLPIIAGIFGLFLPNCCGFPGKK